MVTIIACVFISPTIVVIGRGSAASVSNRCICTCCDPGILIVVYVSLDYSDADSLYAAFGYLVIFGVCHLLNGGYTSVHID